MNGFRNVYRRADLTFLGRWYPSHGAAVSAALEEMAVESATRIIATAEDISEPSWEDEMRGIGRIVGVNDFNASAEVIGDAITSERDTLRNTLRNIAHGPFMPPPDPSAHSWRSYAGFWEAEVGRIKALARLALRDQPEAV